MTTITKKKSEFGFIFGFVIVVLDLVAIRGVAAAGLVAVFANTIGLLPWEPIVSVALLGLLLSFCGGWIVLGIGAVLADRRGSTVPVAGA